MNVERELIRLYVWSGVMGLIGTIIGCWITYLILKAAIREGIKESGLVHAVGKLQKVDTTHLPNVKAD